MENFQQLKHWYHSLPAKEQVMVTATGILLAITLFYLAVWEPIHLGLKQEQNKQQSQAKTLGWMKGAALEVQKLRSSGNRSVVRDKNKPVTLVIEQAINNAGLKSSVNKIESSGNNGARVTLNNAPFNQVLIWLNTISKHNGIQVVSANIERAAKEGQANARFTFERP